MSPKKKRRKIEIAPFVPPVKIPLLEPPSTVFSLTSYVKGIEISKHFADWDQMIANRLVAYKTIESKEPQLPSLLREFKNAQSYSWSRPDSDNADMSSFRAECAYDDARRHVDTSRQTLDHTSVNLTALIPRLKNDWMDILLSELWFLPKELLPILLECLHETTFQ